MILSQIKLRCLMKLLSTWNLYSFKYRYVLKPKEEPFFSYYCQHRSCRIQNRISGCFCLHVPADFVFLEGLYEVSVEYLGPLHLRLLFLEPFNIFLTCLWKFIPSHGNFSLWLRLMQMMSMGCGMMPMMYTGMQQYMPHMAMGMGMNQPLPPPSFMPFPNMLAAQRPLPTQAHMGGYPLHASDPSRVYLPNQQSDPTSNQPQYPAFMDPYQQFRNLHPTQPPQFQVLYLHLLFHKCYFLWM